MKIALALLIGLLAGITAAPPATAEEPLRHNPFARPALGDPASGEKADSGALQLRGTLVAGKHSLANVAGELLQIGERTGRYELLAVTETSATFRHGAQSVTIHLDEPDDGTEEDEDADD